MNKIKLRLLYNEIIAVSQTFLLYRRQISQASKHERCNMFDQPQYV